MSEKLSELAELRVRLERIECAHLRWKQGTAVLLGLGVCALLAGAAADRPDSVRHVMQRRKAEILRDNDELIF
jgi:hypothetical protein